MQFNIKQQYLYIVLCVLLFGFSNNSHAQDLIYLRKGFTNACASPDFNTYTIDFRYNASAFTTGNEFNVELSDENGDFSNSQIITPNSTTNLGPDEKRLEFSFPEDIGGENYRVRVRSTAPEQSSPNASQPFAAYFRVLDIPFFINNKVQTAAFCQGSSYLLTIDPQIDAANSNNSPLFYPFLTYNWFREVNGTITPVGDGGPTLTVTEEGDYFARINYGSCTPGSLANSNIVTITEATNGQISTNIVSSLGNPFCPDNGPTTLTSISGNSYQWFKDNELIDGATNQSLQTEESGEYEVLIDLGGCTATASFTLISQLFESSINVAAENFIDEGDILTVIVTDNADAPTYEWYFNNTLIAGETTNTLQATEFGSYRVVISQTVGCEVSVEYLFTIEEDIDLFPDVSEIPNIISPNGDNINDTWIIPTEYVSGTDTDIRIFSSQGKLVFETNDYQNNWPVETLQLTSVNEVYYYIITPQNGGERKGSITVIK